MSTNTIHIDEVRERTSITSIRADYTVFIVEDSYAQRTLLENYLQKLPRSNADTKPQLDILTFETGEECLEKLHLKSDIVVLDYYLDDEDHPDAINGLLTLKKIRQKLPDTEIIVMSNQKDVIVVSELFNNGITEYISKKHACHVRVEAAILRIIKEKEHKKMERIRGMIASLVLFIAGICLGYWVF